MVYIYDYRMKEFLSERNQRYICSGYALSNGKQFWQYLETEELSKLLRQYNK